MPPLPPDRHRGPSAGNEPQRGAPDAKVRELLQKGIAAHANGKDDQAEKIFRDVLKNDPYDPNAYYNLGAMAEKRGDLAAALGDYRTALVAHPDDVQLQAAVAQVEDQIARKQGGHFQNPLLYKDASHTVLRGNASDIGVKSGINGGSGYAMNPSMAPPPQSGPFFGQSTQSYQPPYQPPAMTISQQQPPPQRRFNGNAAAAASEFAVNMVGGGLRGGPAGFVNALHCPICRLLH